MTKRVELTIEVEESVHVDYTDEEIEQCEPHVEDHAISRVAHAFTERLLGDPKEYITIDEVKDE